MTVEPDVPILRFVKAQQQLCERAFAAACTTDERNGVAGGDVQIDTVKRHPTSTFVCEADTIEFQFAAHLIHRKMLALIRNRHARLQHIHHALNRRHRALEKIGHLGKTRERPQ